MSGAAPQSSRWAILGTGDVSGKFVNGLRRLGGRVTVQVVASRAPVHAERFAVAYAVPRSADYATAAAADDVDVVYVATPPSEHEAHALLAITAGKAVVVEKPFAADAKASRRIADAAAGAGVFCMEAMWTRFLPLTVAIKSLIDAGELGEIRAFEGSFRDSDVPDAAISMFDRSRQGGALMHRGVYPLSLARHFLGPVEAVEALGRVGDTGVDDDCALVLSHEGGAVSTVSASLRVAGGNGFTVFGSRARIDVDGPIYRPSSARLVRTASRSHQRSRERSGLGERLRESDLAHAVRQRAGTVIELARRRSVRLRHPYRGNGYHYEAQAVINAIGRGQLSHEIMPIEQSIEIMGIVDAARARWDPLR